MPIQRKQASRKRSAVGRAQPDALSGTTFTGKQARTGNSYGFRFERELFRTHPEFMGDVKAHVLAPGSILVVAEQAHSKRSSGPDPIMNAFLGFLAQDIARSPDRVTPLDKELAGRMDALVKGVDVSPDGDLGDEALL